MLAELFGPGSHVFLGLKIDFWVEELLDDFVDVMVLTFATI